MAWSDREMREANLIHGPDSMNSDTYRLHVEGQDGKPGKMLDVPGWMVGDPEGAELRLRAARIIRARTIQQSQTQKELPWDAST